MWVGVLQISTIRFKPVWWTSSLGSPIQTSSPYVGHYDLTQLLEFASQATTAEAVHLEEIIDSIYDTLPFPSPLASAEAYGPLDAAAIPLAATAFAIQANMDPRAVQLLANGSQNAEEWLTPAQVYENIAATFGSQQYADLAVRSERTFALGTLSLMAALGGGDLNDLVRILGADNPASRPLAQAILKLAQAMSQTPPDLMAVERALMDAHHKAIPHAAGNDFQLKMAEKLFHQYYGIGGSSSDGYAGQGPWANAAQSHVPDLGSPEDGRFVTNDPSQAGTAALRAATSQIGVCEATGNNDGIPSQRFCSGQREPWCANFVAWSFRQAGQPLPGNQDALGSVKTMEAGFKRRGEFHRGPPKPGDVIFFRSPSGQRHVGIVERVENGRVHTVEGNSGNRVARRSYDLGSSRIAGYGRRG